MASIFDPIEFERVFSNVIPNVKADIQGLINVLNPAKSSAGLLADEFKRVQQEVVAASNKMSKLTITKQSLDAVKQLGTQQLSIISDLKEKTKGYAQEAIDRVQHRLQLEKEAQKRTQEVIALINTTPADVGAIISAQTRLRDKYQEIVLAKKLESTEKVANSKRLDELKHAHEAKQAFTVLESKKSADLKKLESTEQQKSIATGFAKKGLSSIGIEAAGMEEGIKKVAMLMGATEEGLAAAALPLAAAAAAIAAIVALIALGVNRFFQLDKAAGDFRKTTGLINDSAKLFTDRIGPIQYQLAGWGVTIDDTQKTTTALVERFGSMSPAVINLIKPLTLLSKLTNVTEEDAAGLADNIRAVSDGSEAAVYQWTAVLQKVSDINKGLKDAPILTIPFNKVVHDIATASGKTLLAFQGNTKELVKAAVQARLYGVSLETVSAEADNILDFQKSVNDEMQLSVLLGRNINYQSARQDFWQGNLTAGMDEQNKILASMSDAELQNRLIVKSTADLFGESTDELQKQIKMQRYMANNPTKVEDLKVKLGDAYSYLFADANETLEQQSEDFVKQLSADADQRTTQQKLESLQTDVLTTLAAVTLPEVDFVLKELIHVLAAMNKDAATAEKRMFIRGGFTSNTDQSDFLDLKPSLAEQGIAYHNTKDKRFVSVTPHSTAENNGISDTKFMAHAVFDSITGLNTTTPTADMKLQESIDSQLVDKLGNIFEQKHEIISQDKLESIIHQNFKKSVYEAAVKEYQSVITPENLESSSPPITVSPPPNVSVPIGGYNAGNINTIPQPANLPSTNNQNPPSANSQSSNLEPKFDKLIASFEGLRSDMRAGMIISRMDPRAEQLQ